MPCRAAMMAPQESTTTPPSGSTRGGAGRKNWLFTGSDRGGARAAICSLIEAAKLNGLDPETYLRDVHDLHHRSPGQPDRRAAALEPHVTDSVIRLMIELDDTDPPI